MYDIDRALRRLELAQRIDELQRQKAATADQGLPLGALSDAESAASQGAGAGRSVGDATPADGAGALPIAELAAMHASTNGHVAEPTATLDPQPENPVDADGEVAAEGAGATEGDVPKKADGDGRAELVHGPSAGEDSPPARLTLLPQAVAPMPLSSWASPPRSGTADSLVTVTRVLADRPRPSAADLLPRAVVPLPNGSFPASGSLWPVEAEVPGPRGGSGHDELLTSTDASADADTATTEADENQADEPVDHSVADPIDDTDHDEHAASAPVGENADDVATPTRAVERETPADSGSTAASIIADLLRQGNRSLLG